MPKNKLFIIILLSFLSTLGYGQNEIDITFKWNDIVTIDLDETHQISKLNFDGCVYDDISSKTPLYSLLVPVNEFHENYKVEVLSSKTAELNPIEKGILSTKANSKINFSFEQISSNKEKYIRVLFEPFQLSQNAPSKLTHIKIKLVPEGNILKKGKGNSYVDNSVLAKNNWYKVRIATSGLFKITSNEMASMGFGSSIPLNEIRLYGNGGALLNERAGNRVYDDLMENAIEIYDLNSNQLFDANDYFIFYGQGPVTWNYNESLEMFVHQNHHYDSYAHYFITTQPGVGKRIETSTTISQPSTKNIDKYLHYIAYDKDSLNLIKSGKTFFYKKFDIIKSYKFNFNFPSINTDSMLMLRVSAAARSFDSSDMRVSLNTTSQTIPFGYVFSDPTGNFASPTIRTLKFPISSTSVTSSFVYNKPNNSSIAWLDYALANAWCNLKMNGQQMMFSNPLEVDSGGVATYIISNTNSNLKVWDVSNGIRPKQLPTTLSNNEIHFKAKTDSLKKYLAFYGGYYNVELVGSVANQNLHAVNNIDYVIVTHPNFISTAEKLKKFHTDYSGYNVYITTPTLLYNEFSSGTKDAGAIRDFMKMLYDKANLNGTTPPRYLLLLGDGSYDNKNRLSNNTNYLPSFQSSESLRVSRSYTSDDFFGILDDNEGANASGALDIGVGRFPVTTLSQANQIMDKIYRYTKESDQNSVGTACTGGSINVSNMANWRNVIAFVGDDEETMIHTRQANELANMLHQNNPIYNINKIFFDAYPQITVPGGQRYPEAKRDLLQQVEKGALIVSYTGHGGEAGWAHESVLEVGNILSMSNQNNMPVFFTATCEFSRFDDPERTSAGEYVLLNPDGGGISLFTTSRLAYSNSNYNISRAFFKNAFVKINGEYPAMGDLLRIAKVNSSNDYANRNFLLLGDPGLKMAYPKDQVITTQINNQNIGSVNDTLTALSKVTIKGEVHSNGSLNSSFSGVVYPTIYDKTTTYFTLGNDIDSYEYPFELQNNIIYKGKAIVTNGEFEYSFIVPKDIAYNYGNGKISYYAQNGVSDAHGYYDSLFIGGSNPNPEEDMTGPSIQLFVNDSLFVSGGITNENPLLLAYIYDKNGINTTGNGIGHDIVATLDFNSLNPIVLNDYYEGSTNSYQNGTVRYPFQDLSIGKHTLSIKVWDIYNNSATAYVEFEVNESNQMTISKMYNYPNPFTITTSFVFEHNQACEQMEVEVYIYDLLGRKVQKLSGEAQCNGYQISSADLKWDGRNQAGNLLPSGMYVYLLRVKTDNTGWTSRKDKMIIVR